MYERPVYHEGSSTPATFYPTHFWIPLKVDKKRSGPNGLVLTGRTEDIKRLERGLYVTTSRVRGTTSRNIGTVFVSFRRSTDNAPDRWELTSARGVSMYADVHTGHLVVDCMHCEFVGKHLKACGFEGLAGAFETRRLGHPLI